MATVKWAEKDAIARAKTILADKESGRVDKERPFFQIGWHQQSAVSLARSVLIMCGEDPNEAS